MQFIDPAAQILKICPASGNQAHLLRQGNTQSFVYRQSRAAVTRRLNVLMDSGKNSRRNKLTFSTWNVKFYLTDRHAGNPL